MNGNFTTLNSKPESDINSFNIYSPESLTQHTIVLDLDETLVHSSEDMNDFHGLNIGKNPELKEIEHRIYFLTLEEPDSSQKSNLWGITRPYLREFLIFCFNYFEHVCVWSAGQTRYVETLIKKICSDIKLPKLIYSNPKCVQSDGVLQKPLLRIIDENPEMNLSLEHTFMLDDRRSVFSNCNPSNGILIPAYMPLPLISSLKESDNCFSQLIRWFLLPEVIMSDDVRMLDKSCIFMSEDPIYLTQPNLRSRSRYSSPRAEHLPRSDESKRNEGGTRSPPRSSRTSGSRSPPVLDAERLKPTEIHRSPRAKRTMNDGSPRSLRSSKSPRSTRSSKSSSTNPASLVQLSSSTQLAPVVQQSTRSPRARSPRSRSTQPIQPATTQTQSPRSQSPRSKTQSARARDSRTKNIQNEISTSTIGEMKNTRSIRSPRLSGKSPSHLPNFAPTISSKVNTMGKSNDMTSTINSTNTIRPSLYNVRSENKNSRTYSSNFKNKLVQKPSTIAPVGYVQTYKSD